MDDCTILNVNIIPDSDIMYIAPYNGIKPNTAFIAYNNISNNGRIFGNKTIGADLGKKTFNFFDECHLRINVLFIFRIIN